MLTIGDVNGDGFVDVAVANRLSDDITIVRTDGSGGLQFDASYIVGDFPVAIDLGDIDGLDVLSWKWFLPSGEEGSPGRVDNLSSGHLC
jgi:hypothetical protein